MLKMPKQGIFRSVCIYQCMQMEITTNNAHGNRWSPLAFLHCGGQLLEHRLFDSICIVFQLLKPQGQLLEVVVDLLLRLRGLPFCHGVLTDAHNRDTDDFSDEVLLQYASCNINEHPPCTLDKFQLEAIQPRCLSPSTLTSPGPTLIYNKL